MTTFYAQVVSSISSPQQLTALKRAHV